MNECEFFSPAWSSDAKCKIYGKTLSLKGDERGNVFKNVCVSRIPFIFHQ